MILGVTRHRPIGVQRAVRVVRNVAIGLRMGQRLPLLINVLVHHGIVVFTVVTTGSWARFLAKVGRSGMRMLCRTSRTLPWLRSAGMSASSVVHAGEKIAEGQATAVISRMKSWKGAGEIVSISDGCTPGMFSSQYYIGGRAGFSLSSGLPRKLGLRLRRYVG